MAEVTIRQLREDDVPAAGRIFSLAFGTFLGVPEPENFWSDIDYIGTRSKADPSGAFAAEVEGNLVGSNVATNWGSVGFFGPLTVLRCRLNIRAASRTLIPSTKWARRTLRYRSTVYIPPASPPSAYSKPREKTSGGTILNRHRCGSFTASVAHYYSAVYTS